MRFSVIFFAGKLAGERKKFLPLHRNREETPIEMIAEWSSW